ncbi:hypothetical protein ES703_19828 [subsurface metagenome]
MVVAIHLYLGRVLRVVIWVGLVEDVPERIRPVGLIPAVPIIAAIVDKRRDQNVCRDPLVVVGVGVQDGVGTKRRIHIHLHQGVIDMPLVHLLEEARAVIDLEDDLGRRHGAVPPIQHAVGYDSLPTELGLLNQRGIVVQRVVGPDDRGHSHQLWIITSKHRSVVQIRPKLLELVGIEIGNASDHVHRVVHDVPARPELLPPRTSQPRPVIGEHPAPSGQHHVGIVGGIAVPVAVPRGIIVHHLRFPGAQVVTHEPALDPGSEQGVLGDVEGLSHHIGAGIIRIRGIPDAAVVTLDPLPGSSSWVPFPMGASIAQRVVHPLTEDIAQGDRLQLEEEHDEAVLVDQPPVAPVPAWITQREVDEAHLLIQCTGDIALTRALRGEYGTGNAHWVDLAHHGVLTDSLNARPLATPAYALKGTYALVLQVEDHRIAGIAHAELLLEDDLLTGPSHLGYLLQLLGPEVPASHLDEHWPLRPIDPVRILGQADDLHRLLTLGA